MIIMNAPAVFFDELDALKQAFGFAKNCSLSSSNWPLVSILFRIKYEINWTSSCVYLYGLFLMSSYSMEAIVGFPFLGTGTTAVLTFESSETVMNVFL